MKYIETNLLQQEKLIHFVRPHWVVFSSACWMVLFALFFWIYLPQSVDMVIYNSWTLRGITTLVLFLIGAYWFLRAYIYYTTSEYGVTNKRVLIKVGWIQRISLELLLDKVEGVSVDQTIMGRI